MKNSVKKEWPHWALISLPFIYLAYVWGDLKETVPIHWNAMGEIDGWGSKYMLLAVPFILPVFVYLIFVLIQRFGPKAKMEKMGRKFNSLKFILVLFMSVLALFIIHSSKEGSVGQPTFLFVALGLLFATLGNFFKTIQPNYFLGIRTPWTLRNEEVWKRTHELGGKLWFVGGLLVAIIAVISTSTPALITMITIVVIITIVPVVFSYTESRKLKQTQN